MPAVQGGAGGQETKIYFGVAIRCSEKKLRKMAAALPHNI